MKKFTKDESHLADFIHPTALPRSEAQKEEWQSANRAWWEKNPMRYDWTSSIEVPEFSQEFYKEIDKRFFRNAAEYLDHRFHLPFDEYISFESLKDKDILEIGVGNGSHAQLLARHGQSFEGIDLTEYSVRSVLRRFALFGISGKVKQMDAESLQFQNQSFDFVWSWGVIHHSSNTPRILEEIYRVLRPNGRAVIMVYHRGWWNYYTTGFLRAFMRGDLFRGISIHESKQSYTDGALARYYGTRDFTALAQKIGFIISNVITSGPKSDIIPIPNSKFKKSLCRIFPNTFNRFFTRTCHMGTFLIVTLKKSSHPSL